MKKTNKVNIVNKQSAAAGMLLVLLSGCSTITTPINITSEDLSTHKLGSPGFMTDYGKGIKYNKQEDIHQLSIYIGGEGGCNMGALAYGKPKLDEYMKKNEYSSYVILKGEYSVLPIRKCELYVKFKP